MCKELKFVVGWDDDRQNTWSGTTHNIFNALSSYFKIKEIELPKRSLYDKVQNKLFPDCGIRYVEKCRRHVSGMLKDGGDLFQFTDIVYDTDCLSTYVYQDLNVSYIKYMAEYKPVDFGYSGFSSLSMKVLEKRMLCERNYYDVCSGIFTMGRWLKDYLLTYQGLNSEKVFHVGGGINIDSKLILNEPRRGNKILFVGRDFRRKGGYLVYQAFKKLRKKIPNLHLYVVGLSKDPIEYADTGYHFCGNLNFKELPALFNSCDIFCMPSYFEAYGLVFIEALSYGLPCIGRNAYEMPYFIDENETGHLLQNDDVNELADKIEDLLGNRRIGQNVQDRRDEYLKEYSWDSVARRIKEVICD